MIVQIVSGKLNRLQFELCFENFDFPSFMFIFFSIVKPWCVC